MRFMIVSSQGKSLSPDGGPAGMMQVLDFIEAPSASDAIDVFKEDNLPYMDSGFTEFLCVPLSEDGIVRFASDKEE